MSLAQGPQRSDAGEAQARSLSVSSQALYHCLASMSSVLVIIAAANSEGSVEYAHTCIRRLTRAFTVHIHNVWMQIKAQTEL